MGRILENPPLHSALYRFETPMRSPHFRLSVRPQEQQMILPHIAFSVLYHHHVATFHEQVLGGAGAIERFWLDMAGRPSLAGHPLRERPQWQKRTVPLAIHGDGTPVHGVGKAWARLLDSYSWSSILATGTTLDFTMLIYCVFVNPLTKGSMANVWRIICWSFL